ncbi:hypothetical protein L204_106399 [Cryptococcus depauperatus]
MSDPGKSFDPVHEAAGNSRRSQTHLEPSSGGTNNPSQHSDNQTTFTGQRHAGHWTTLDENDISPESQRLMDENPDFRQYMAAIQGQIDDGETSRASSQQNPTFKKTSNQGDTNAASQPTQTSIDPTSAPASSVAGGTNDPSTGTSYGAEGSRARMPYKLDQIPAGNSLTGRTTTNGRINYKEEYDDLGKPKWVFDGFAKKDK